MTAQALFRASACALGLLGASLPAAGKAAEVIPAPNGDFWFSATYSINSHVNVQRLLVDVILDSAVEVEFSESFLFQLGAVWGGEYYVDTIDTWSAPDSIVATSVGYTLQFTPFFTSQIFNAPNNDRAGERWWFQKQVQVIGKGMAGGPFNYEIAFSEEGRSRIPSPVPEPANWALLTCGFGMVGGAVRVRRRTSFTALRA